MNVKKANANTKVTPATLCADRGRWRCILRKKFELIYGLQGHQAHEEIRAGRGMHKSSVFVVQYVRGCIAVTHASGHRFAQRTAHTHAPVFRTEHFAFAAHDGLAPGAVEAHVNLLLHRDTCADRTARHLLRRNALMTQTSIHRTAAADHRRIGIHHRERRGGRAVRLRNFIAGGRAVEIIIDANGIFGVAAFIRSIAVIRRKHALRHALARGTRALGAVGIDIAIDFAIVIAAVPIDTVAVVALLERLIITDNAAATGLCAVRTACVSGAAAERGALRPRQARLSAGATAGSIVRQALREFGRFPPSTSVVGTFAHRGTVTGGTGHEFAGRRDGSVFRVHAELSRATDDDTLWLFASPADLRQQRRRRLTSSDELALLLPIPRIPRIASFALKTCQQARGPLPRARAVDVLAVCTDVALVSGVEYTRLDGHLSRGHAVLTGRAGYLATRIDDRGLQRIDTTITARIRRDARHADGADVRQAAFLSGPRAECDSAVPACIILRVEITHATDRGNALSARKQRNVLADLSVARGLRAVCACIHVTHDSVIGEYGDHGTKTDGVTPTDRCLLG